MGTPRKRGRGIGGMSGRPGVGRPGTIFDPNEIVQLPNLNNKHDRYCSFCKSIISKQVLAKPVVCTTCFMPIPLRSAQADTDYKRCSMCDAIVSGSHPFCYLCGFALLVNSAEHRDHRIANAPAMERAYKQKLAQAKSPAKPTASTPTAPTPLPRQANVKRTTVSVYPPQRNSLDNDAEDDVLRDVDTPMEISGSSGTKLTDESTAAFNNEHA